MKHFNFTITESESLMSLLNSEELIPLKGTGTQLVQIFSARNEPDWFISLGKILKQELPSSVVIGASSVGEISYGKLLTDSTVVAISFFESSDLNLFSYHCQPGDEEITGKLLFSDIKSLNVEPKGVLLFSNPVTSDSTTFFNSFTSCGLSYPVFGGGAGDYANMRNTLVYDGKTCSDHGIVAIAFSGENLHIEPFTYLGWHPLSKEMTITKVDGMSVKEIDNTPAFSLFKKYLDIKYDDSFFHNVLEFPFLINRDNHIIARVPFFVNEQDNSIEFLADIREGETFRIGYGNPQTIINESFQIQNKLSQFKPEAIYLYTCICRRFLMQQDVEHETEPFNQIAPTAGFYTFGEFYAGSKLKALLNSTMVAVGIREGEKNTNRPSVDLAPTGNKKYTDDPFENKHTRILSHLLYFIDATTKELEEQNTKLKILNEQKNELLGIAAHDLRNPLGVIQGFAEMLEEQVSDDLKEYASTINIASGKLLQLLNDLLDISKIEAGKLDLKIDTVDFINLAEQNIKMNRYLAINKGIRLFVEYDATPQIVQIDAEKIEQVLNNLIGNAIKYSPRNTTVRVKILSQNNQLVVQVIDQGQGIRAHEINEIFQPFKKASSSPTGEESSHGLGLAIVKKIIEGHHGTIHAESEIGKGSTFTFTLPLKP